VIQKEFFNTITSATDIDNRTSEVMEEVGYWPTFALHSPAASNTANAPLSHQDCSV
jgi:hypothetical protein